MVVPRLMAGRRRHVASSTTRVTELTEGCKPAEQKHHHKCPTLSKLSRGTLGVSSISRTFGGSTGASFGRLLSPHDEDAALKRPATERDSTCTSWATQTKHSRPQPLQVGGDSSDDDDDDLGSPGPRQPRTRTRQPWQKRQPETLVTAVEDCSNCLLGRQCDWGSSEATTVPSSSYNSFDKDESPSSSPTMSHPGPPPLIGSVNIEDIEEESMDDFDWGDIPRRTPSRVRFSTTQSYEGFTPYREIYGLHPSTFDFDHKGHMVREQRAAHAGRGIEDVDEGDVLVCTSPCGVSFRASPNLSDHVKGFKNVQEGEDIEVLECGSNWVRADGGWLPLYIKGVCIFEMTGPKTVLDLGVPKTGAIASR